MLGSMELKVLFQIRSDYKTNIAGDSIQMQKTKEYLEKLGVKIDVSSQYNADLEKYDLIHIFNTIKVKEPYQFGINAISRNKKYVLSTIYWDLMNYVKNDSTTPYTYELWSKQNGMRKELLTNSSLLLPNSEIEMHMIKNNFNINQEYLVVPNCADRYFYHATPTDFVAKYNIKDFVLCVGRIGHRKNQLSLIRALEGTDLKLVFIGPISDKEYFDKCRKAANQNVVFIDEMKHHELASAYSSAKVHVLSSWFETPGLSSLEAALAGCNIVSTDKGSTKEYFKEMVLYCDPAREESINKSVLKAYNEPRCDILKKYIYENYTWEIAAEKTLEAYNYALKY